MSNEGDTNDDSEQDQGDKDQAPVRESDRDRADHGWGGKAIDWDYCAAHKTRYPSGGKCPQCP